MKSLEELLAIRDKAKAAMTDREGTGDGIRVVVGMATCGIAAFSTHSLTRSQKEILKTLRLLRQAASVCASMSRSLRFLNPARIR